MKSLPLLGCTLDAEALVARRGEWDDLLGRAAGCEEVAGGARYRFAADEALERRVRTLAAAEKACCSFFELDVARTRGGVELTITAPPHARAALRSLLGRSTGAST